MTTTATKPVQKINVGDLKKGHCFSETSHYVFQKKASPDTFEFIRTETNSKVVLGKDYVEQMLNSAEQYHEEMIVGKEDKHWTQKQIDDAIKAGTFSKTAKDLPRVGDLKVPGIRTIWANILGQDVFAVEYRKNSKKKSETAFQEEKEAMLTSLLKNCGDRVSLNNVKKLLSTVIDNPVLDHIPGEIRRLKGYKIQFESVNGQYNVIDMEIEQGYNVRSVNVNEITQLVYKGILYIVK